MAIPTVNQKLAVSFIFLLYFIGCGEDKSPTQNKEIHSLTVTFESSSVTVNLDDLGMHTIDGEKAVMLADLVDTSLVKYPQNYAYRIIGGDGFYAHLGRLLGYEKGNCGGTHIVTGYDLRCLQIVVQCQVTCCPSDHQRPSVWYCIVH